MGWKIVTLKKKRAFAVHESDDVKNKKPVCSFDTFPEACRFIAARWKERTRRKARRASRQSTVPKVVA